MRPFGPGCEQLILRCGLFAAQGLGWITPAVLETKVQGEIKSKEPSGTLMRYSQQHAGFSCHDRVVQNPLLSR